MTLQTKSAHVAEVAFAAALGHGNDVIGIPKRLATFHTPGRFRLQARDAAKAADVRVFGDAIDAADSTNPFVAFEDAFAQMRRIAAQAPLFNAVGGTECMTPGRHFELAPAAEATTVGAFG